MTVESPRENSLDVSTKHRWAPCLETMAVLPAQKKGYGSCAIRPSSAKDCALCNKPQATRRGSALASAGHTLCGLRGSHIVCQPGETESSISEYQVNDAKATRQTPYGRDGANFASPPDGHLEKPQHKYQVNRHATKAVGTHATHPLGRRCYQSD